MKKRLQFTVILSVCFSLIFFGLMLSGNENIVAGDAKLDISSWIPPVRSVTYERLSRQTSGLHNPFKKKLYDEIKLKGFFRATDGIWAGIFQCPDDTSFSLSKGQQYKGITVISIEKDSCRIKFGRSSKTLKLE